MPYEVKHVPGGYLVCSETKCFSRKPLTKKKANKQRVAIAISEAFKQNKPVSNFFI